MQGLRLMTAVCLFSTALVAANNPYVGAWKVNAEKSTFAPGTAFKEMTVTFEAVGDEMKRTVTGIGPDGEQVNMNSTIPWDGNFHKIESPDGPTVDVAVKKVNDYTLRVKVKKEEQIIQTAETSVSKDGKTMTVKEKGEDKKGRKLDNTYVFEKQ